MIKVPDNIKDYKIKGAMAIRISNGDDVYDDDFEFSGKLGELPLALNDVIKMICKQINKDCEVK